MTEEFRIAYDPGFTRQFELLSESAERDPDGSDAQLLIAGLDAIDVLKYGQEAEHRGVRLGFSPNHFDLRDCAEIKVEVLDERTNKGNRRGPSHRMIYREFEGTADDPRPVRQIIAFEHRKDGRPFAVAAARLGRTKGVAAPGLDVLPNTVPALGRDKDPDRPTSPVRLPLPPDLAAALATAPVGLPTRHHDRSPALAGRNVRNSGPPGRRLGRTN